MQKRYNTRLDINRQLALGIDDDVFQSKLLQMMILLTRIVVQEFFFKILWIYLYYLFKYFYI